VLFFGGFRPYLSIAPSSFDLSVEPGSHRAHPVAASICPPRRNETVGCGSWNADNILSHPFDRGAFGFQRKKCGAFEYLCCTWPVYGGAVNRHRCQCNGPLWNRAFTDCGGWWCEEWACSICLCVYTYSGFENPDEVAFASSIALQAYFEDRAITRDDMDRCIEFWRNHISEEGDPIGRKRPVMCEPYHVPCYDCYHWYRWTHPKRDIPYADDEVTDQVKEVSSELRSIPGLLTAFDSPTKSNVCCFSRRFTNITK